MKTEEKIAFGLAVECLKEIVVLGPGPARDLALTTLVEIGEAVVGDTVSRGAKMTNEQIAKNIIMDVTGIGFDAYQDSTSGELRAYLDAITAALSDPQNKTATSNVVQKSNISSCIDCGRPTTPGPGSARCEDCWNSRFGE
jgi:hypothetical protein